MPDYTTLQAVVVALVAALGPAGAAFAVVAGVLGYFYRRDIIKKNGVSRDALAQILPAFIENARASEKLAGAIDELRKQQEKTAETLNERVEHAINGGFHNVLLELRSQR